ncbi:arginine repressor [Bifidobacterium xylocopae]|uniref:Arginine repressor n=1 Tax=Bifidobacterium xylocopae TaxID=2493119 RepID=A0A366KE33_9BIFI|nr:arginine repressor [Bifidobacterium xylocopae]RBP99976.1 arginine repressor [Bifidobacterium xylocopae]
MRPASKTARLDAIRQLVAQDQVTSQQQLAKLLNGQGIEVTQATLSRDLDELGAAKIRYPDGVLAYWIPDVANQSLLEAATVSMAQGGEVNKTEAYLTRVLTGLITSVKRAGNLLLVRTPSGAAQYAASALDRQPLTGILGTIAGDDTVLIIANDDQSAQERGDWLLDLTSGEGGSRSKP